MGYKFCKKCGTLYSDRDGDCPRCAERELTEQGMRETVYDAGMSEEEIERARKRDWKYLVIGVPAFIAFLYLIYFLYKIIFIK